MFSCSSEPPCPHRARKRSGGLLRGVLNGAAATALFITALLALMCLLHLVLGVVLDIAGPGYTTP